MKAGDVLCEVETDKAVLEVESAEAGTLLARFCEAGDEVAVLQSIAVIGRAGESVAEYAPAETLRGDAPGPAIAPAATLAPGPRPNPQAKGRLAISPRARHLARNEGVDVNDISGSGPQGRIIERDIQALIDSRTRLSPVAKKMLDSGDFRLPGDSIGAGRLTSSDLVPAAADAAEEVTAIPLRGIRKTIARRMLESLQTTAQLTLHRSANAVALRQLRGRFKSADKALGLNDITINDLLLFAVARTLPVFPALNARFEDDTIYQHAAVQLGMAVDTKRGLLVPVIRDADRLSLRAMSQEARRLSEACREGAVLPDELSGGTFTVSNLGGLGIETFTPILNPPQVAILGVGAISLKPVVSDAGVDFTPQIALSLTVNHQVVDGAPAARFLAQLAQNLRDIDLLLLAESV